MDTQDHKALTILNESLLKENDYLRKAEETAKSNLKIAEEKLAATTIIMNAQDEVIKDLEAELFKISC